MAAQSEQSSARAAPLLASSNERQSSRVGLGLRVAAFGLGTACVAAATGAALVSTSRGNGPASDVAVLPSMAVAEPMGGKVRVDVYGMAGCPFTRAFVEGPLSETVAVASELVDLRLHAFGNNYHPTRECGGTAEGMPFASYNKGYNMTIRECWDGICGAAAAEPAEDCFSGPLVCQHGSTDGMMTTAWACAMRSVDMVASKFMPFVRCTAVNFLGVTSETTFKDVVARCAASAGMNEQEVLQCAVGPVGEQLLMEEARTTVPHPSVPYVIIDGQLLNDTKCVACGDGIMNKVCQAWRVRGGQDSPACEGIFGLI